MNVNFTNKFVLYILLLVVGLSLPAWVSAQYEAVSVETPRAETLEIQLSSSPYRPQVMTSPNNGTVKWLGSDNVLGLIGDNTLYYTPDSPTFIGRDTMKVGYWKFTEFGPAFTQRFIYVTVLPSIVTARDDYAATNLNQTIFIDVLANDEGNGTNLTIKSPILMENNGHANVANGMIAFTPDDDFEGVAHLNYIACDDLNTCDLATVSVCVFDFSNPGNDSLHIITRKNEAEVVLLPVSDYQMTTAPANGTYDTSGEVAQYIPNNNFVGQDAFIFEKNWNGTMVKKTVVVDVLDIPAENEFAFDDYFYTAEGEEMEGNVLSNDIGGASLRNPEITVQPRKGTASLDAYGNLIYEPYAGYEGIDRVTYQISQNINGENPEEATAFIFISNQDPVATTFSLTTPKNRPLVIGYGATVDYYGFKKSSEPQYGTVLLGDVDQEVLGHNISAEDVIVYIPGLNVTGQDKFEIEYCITENDCTPIKIKVEILDIDAPAEHFCVAKGCVWSGDTNNDGIVNMQDLLPIGLCMGEVGFDRPNPDLATWYGQYGPDWLSLQESLALDLKYIDTDGNGVVSAVDTTAIREFYGKVHTIIPESVGEADPVKLYPGRPDTIPLVGPGAILEIPILLGTEDFPAVDAYGFTFNIDYSASSEVIDEESVEIVFKDDSWMAYNSPILNMTHSSMSGQVEAGYTRTSGVAASGYGDIGVVKFIIEDVIDGLKLNNTQFTININSSSIMNSAGETSSLASNSYTFQVDLSKKAETASGIDATQVQLAPNPTSNWLRVDLYSQLEAARVEVYSLTGQRVLQKDNINSNRAELNVSHLPMGMYFMQVYTTEGGTVQKKFEVVR